MVNALFCCLYLVCLVLGLSIKPILGLIFFNASILLCMSILNLFRKEVEIEVKCFSDYLDCVFKFIYFCGAAFIFCLYYRSLAMIVTAIVLSVLLIIDITVIKEKYCFVYRKYTEEKYLNTQLKIKSSYFNYKFNRKKQLFENVKEKPYYIKLSLLPIAYGSTLFLIILNTGIGYLIIFLNEISLLLKIFICLLPTSLMPIYCYIYYNSISMLYIKKNNRILILAGSYIAYCLLTLTPILSKVEMLSYIYPFLFVFSISYIIGLLHLLSLTAQYYTCQVYDINSDD